MPTSKHKKIKNQMGSFGIRKTQRKKQAAEDRKKLFSDRPRSSDFGLFGHSSLISRGIRL